MGYVLNPETGAMEWVQSSFALPHPELERQAQADYEARRKAASQDVINEAMKKPDYLANDERYLRDLGRTIAEKESAVAPPLKVPGVVTELDVSGSKRPVVSFAEGFNRPVSAQEVIAKTAPVKELTPEEQQYKLMRLRDQRIAVDQAYYEKQKQAKLAAIAPSGIMDGDRIRMYVASTNKAATPYTLNAYKNAYDAASGATNKELSPEDLQIALQPLSPTDYTSFNAKGKTHVTGFNQEATASDIRFRTAVQQDFTQGKAKADVMLNALGRTPTLSEWNDIIDKSYSNVTRATARMDMPREMLENVDIAEANRTPFAAALVRDKGITPAEAKAIASDPKYTESPAYVAWEQKQEPGSFYKGKDGKPAIREWTEGQYKAEALKQAQVTLKNNLFAGMSMDHKNKAVNDLYEAYGGGEVINFAEKDAPFDRTTYWKGNPKGTVATNLSADALDTVTKMAMENIKTQDMGGSIDSAIAEGRRSGALKGLENNDAYASFANKVYDRMKGINEKKDEELRARVKDQVANEMSELYKMLSKTDKDGNVKANPNTFHGFEPEQALDMVKENGVNQGNINQKAREILERTIGLSTDTPQGLALHSQLSLPDRTMMSREVGAAFDFIKVHLQNGLMKEADFGVKNAQEEQKRQIFRDTITAENTRNGLLTEWIKDPTGNDKPITFRSSGERQAWTQASTEQRKVMEQQKELESKDFAVKKVTVNEDISRLKQGYVKFPVLTFAGKSPYGLDVEKFGPRYEKATEEWMWDAGKDSLRQDYLGHPELWNQVEKEFDDAKSKWTEDLVKKNWTKKVGRFSALGIGTTEPVKVDDVITAIKEMQKMEGTATESAVTDKLKELNALVPGIGEYIIGEKSLTKFGKGPLGERMLEKDNEPKITVSEKDNEAVAWAKANPNDPRSEEILKLNKR